jgi:O-antigen/teichoic acid export membrane protein
MGRQTRYNPGRLRPGVLGSRDGVVGRLGPEMLEARRDREMQSRFLASPSRMAAGRAQRVTASSGRARSLRSRITGPATSDFAAFATSTFVYQGCRLFLNLMAAAVLGPEAFGAWTLFITLVLYSNFVSLGITNGAGRQVPYLLGAGRPEEAALAEDVTLLGVGASGLVAAVIAVGVGSFTLGAGSASLGLVVLFSIAVLLQQFFLLQQVLLRSRFRFRAAAAQMVVLGITTLLVGLPLLRFGLIGLAVTQVAVYIVALTLATRLLARAPRPVWDPEMARLLVSVGLPIMLAGLLFGLLTTMDRWLVLIFLGQVQVGYYGLVAIAVSSLLLLPGIVSQQYYPRLAFAHGAGLGGNALLAFATRQSLISGGFTAMAALPTALIAWFAIPRILPAYDEAVVPLLIVLIGLSIYGLGAAYGDLLNTIGAQRLYLAIQALALAVNISLSVLFLRAGLGLLGVATATTISMTVYAILLILSGRHLAHGISPTPQPSREVA